MQTSKKTQDNYFFLIVSILGSIILLIIAYFLFRKVSDNKKNIDNLEQINKSIEQITAQTNELLKKSSQDGSSNSEETLKLVKSVADQIRVMENNLFRMDKDTRGLNRIEKAIENLRTNMQIMGYEISKLIGEKINEGDIIDLGEKKIDPSMEPNTKIIIKVIKAKILFKGELIQKAKVDYKSKD